MKSAFEMFGAVSPTLESLEVRKNAALLIGGAGLAAYGVRTHRGVNAAVLSGGKFLYQPFDVDALLPEDDFEALRQTVAGIDGAYLGQARIDVPAQAPRLLPFSGILYDRQMRQEMFTDGTQPEVVDGINVLPAFRIARHKNERNEPRDVVGLVLGHKDAYHDRLPVVTEIRWLKEIQVALRRARSLHTTPPEEVQQITKDFAFPNDFMDALNDDFQDEAFRDIPS